MSMFFFSLVSFVSILFSKFKKSLVLNLRLRNQAIILSSKYDTLLILFLNIDNESLTGKLQAIEKHVFKILRLNSSIYR